MFAFVLVPTLLFFYCHLRQIENLKAR